MGEEELADAIQEGVDAHRSGDTDTATNRFGKAVRLAMAFADQLNRARKCVVSTTLERPQWANTTVISENVAESIAKLKLRLMVFPTILGRGKRLFPDGIDRLKLSLADTKSVGSAGVHILTYTRA